MNTIPATVQNNEIREELVPYLRAWARHGVYFGLSGAWRTLARLAGVFNTACIDTGPPTLPTLLQMKQHIPPEFYLSCVLLNESMIYRFPHRHPDPAKRGTVNAHFLNPGPVREHLDLLGQPGAPHARILLLPVDHIYRTEGLGAAIFLETLARFLDGLPTNYRYAVELHNREYLLPDYFHVLCERNIAHVLNTCATTPTILEQIQLPHVLTTDVVIMRTASHIHAETLLGIKETVRRCIGERKSLYAYIDDETGNCSSLASLGGLLEMLNPDLAKLSPIKKKAA